jgi:hypothetical protein
MEYSTPKPIVAVVLTLAVLMLAILSQTSSSASARNLPFHLSHVNHQLLFNQAITRTPFATPTIVWPSHTGLLVNDHTLSNDVITLDNENGKTNPQISNTLSSPVVVNQVTQTFRPEDTQTTDSNNNNNHGHNHDSNNNNNNNNNNDNNGNSLDVQDKSFINGIKITDVDRSNPHLLKVTLEHTNDNNNIPKYIAVVAVGKNDQTVAGSTTLRSDVISNSLTVNVLLKNKDNKNGHLDESADVTVWVVPAALHDILS